MPEITIELIRRRAEHNEGFIHTLEELSLHQEELESINYTLGCNCRRLKILYLQNNIIGEMQNLHHMKELEYLNLALNNISKVQGLHACEFLNKLDLTVNFVDLDELESSVDAMRGNLHLKDLYMMGNPCQAWEGFEPYVMARLPQLERLDGKEITRTNRIRAQQRLPSLREELDPLADEVRQRKRQDAKAGDKKGGAKALKPAGASGIEDGEDGEDIIDGDYKGNYDFTAQHKDGQHSREKEVGNGTGEGDRGAGGAGGKKEEELTKHTPEVRTAIYREMAEQKKEKEDRQKENLPKDRDFDQEQQEAIASAREREAEGNIRQCNEGKLVFRFEETQASLVPEEGGERGGEIVLEVSVPRYLDSSLIDVDVHPHYLSVVIKGKVLRLSLQAEVKASEAKARRSKTTGSLVITMPKVDPNQSIGLLPSATGQSTPGIAANRAAARKSAQVNDVGRSKPRRRGAPTLAAVMMEEAEAAAAAAAAATNGGSRSASEKSDGMPQKAVSIRGMVGPRHGGLAMDETSRHTRHISEVASTKRIAGNDTHRNGSNTASSPVEPSADNNLPTPSPKNGEASSGKKGGRAGTVGVTCPPAPAPAAPLAGNPAREFAAGSPEGSVVWPRNNDGTGAKAGDGGNGGEAGGCD